MTTAIAPQPRRRVQVWFGPHVIVEITAEPDLAERYEHAWSRRFGLPVTNKPLPSASESPARKR
jgi:hypothetical protein